MNHNRSEKSFRFVLDTLRDLPPGLCPFQSRPPGTLRERNTSLLARQYIIHPLLVPNLIPLSPVPPIEAIGVLVIPMYRSGPPQNICHLRATTCNSIIKRWTDLLSKVFTCVAAVRTAYNEDLVVREPIIPICGTH